MTMISVEPFNRLVRLAARAFYDIDVSTGGQQHGQGMAVVVLDALTRRNGHWVREDDLAASLRLQPKSVRRVLRFLEAEMMVTTDQRKEPAAAKRADTAPPKEGDVQEKAKLHLHSYCCLDYAQVVDVLRYRLRRMRKKIDDELTADSRNTVQQYSCPGCARRYSAFDALRLVTEEGFSCEHCGVELVVQADDKIAAEEDGGDDDGDDSKARKRKRREKLNDMRRRMDEQLEPLRAQIQRVEGLPPPEFVSLRAWQRQNAIATAAAAADENACRQNTEFEVAILSPGYGGADQSGTSADSVYKPFPVWMMKPGLNLTEEQRGEASGSVSWKVGEKSECQDDKEEKILKNEYTEADFGRQLGEKFKREDGDVEEEEDGYEWEEG